MDTNSRGKRSFIAGGGGAPSSASSSAASTSHEGCRDIIGLDLGNSRSQWAVYVGDQLKSRTDTKGNQLGANMESPSYFNRDMHTGDLKRASPFPRYTKDTRELEFIPEDESYQPLPVPKMLMGASSTELRSMWSRPVEELTAIEREIRASYQGVKGGHDGLPRLILPPLETQSDDEEEVVVIPIYLVAAMMMQMLVDARNYLVKHTGSRIEVPIIVTSIPCGVLFAFTCHLMTALRAAATALDLHQPKVYVVMEPFAALLAALHDHRGLLSSLTRGKPKYILVIDIGHGTLDLVAFKLEMKQSMVECRVLDYGGDPNLGGAYVNQLLIAFVQRRFNRPRFTQKSGWNKVSNDMDTLEWFLVNLGAPPSYKTDQADMVKRGICDDEWNATEGHGDRLREGIPPNMSRSLKRTCCTYRLPKGSWSILPEETQDFFRLEKSNKNSRFAFNDDEDEDWIGYKILGSDFARYILKPYWSKLEELTKSFATRVLPETVHDFHHTIRTGGGVLIYIPLLFYLHKAPTTHHDDQEEVEILKEEQAYLNSEDKTPAALRVELTSLQKKRKEALEEGLRLTRDYDSVGRGCTILGKYLDEGEDFVLPSGHRLQLVDKHNAHVGMEYTDGKTGESGLFSVWKAKGDPLLWYDRGIELKNTNKTVWVQPGRQYDMNVLQDPSDIAHDKVQGLCKVAARTITIPTTIPTTDQGGMAEADGYAALGHGIHDLQLVFHDDRRTSVHLPLQSGLSDESFNAIVRELNFLAEVYRMKNEEDKENNEEQPMMKKIRGEERFFI